jgi:hypothetical protein
VFLILFTESHSISEYIQYYQKWQFNYKKKTSKKETVFEASQAINRKFIFIHSLSHRHHRYHRRRCCPFCMTVEFIHSSSFLKKESNLKNLM